MISLAEEIAWDVEEKIKEYLREKEAELRAITKAGVKISQGWNGYDIIIAGYHLKAEHDSSMHRWRFGLIGEHSDHTFYDISEKKGDAIIGFLRALQETIKSSGATHSRSEEIIAQDHEENLGKGPLDPAAESEEIIRGMPLDLDESPSDDEVFYLGDES